MVSVDLVESLAVQPLKTLHYSSQVVVSWILQGTEPLAKCGPTGPRFQRCSTFMMGAKPSEEVSLLCAELLKLCPPLSQ